MMLAPNELMPRPLRTSLPKPSQIVGSSSTWLAATPSAIGSLLCRNRGASLMNARAQGDVRARLEQDHPPVRIGGAQHQHLGGDRPDLPRREVDHRDHEAALELLARIVRD